ncbi:hypothetical protein [Ornithinimicrobium murale]|uniref:hypothetical protein n=1 Tax=Ornithinimicrobium murale TaxID=1050153 RepID=UPI000E0DD857|nr:hypothetical protein [Ornithinimicrobium murale]
MIRTSWWDYINPFKYLGDAAGKVVADGWTAAMLGLWNAGLWLLRTVMGWVDGFLTPDLSMDGPAGLIYQTTFWMAGALVLLMLMTQLGLAAFRRDGRLLGQALVGVGQFMMVWVAVITWCAAVVLAASGLTKGLMKALLGVDMWSAWNPWGGFSTEDITDGTLATVLGFMGLVLWISGLGFLIIMLARSGALVVLAATAPIAAGGLVSDIGRTWFWKSARWFHAGALTPVLIVLVIGIGVQLTAGVVNEATPSETGLPTEVGMALIGVILILIACFSPLALFKLLAFIDPSTSSGAAVRAGVQQQGGVKNLFRRQGAESSSGQASQSNQLGQAQGESGAESATTGRFSQAGSGQSTGGAGGSGAGSGASAGGGAAAGGRAAGAAGVAGGVVGGVVGGLAALYGGMKSVGVKGASIGADVTNQAGMGHGSYYPDIGSGEQRRRNHPRRQPDQGEADARRQDGSSETGVDPGTLPTSPRQVPSPPVPGGGSNGPGAGAAGGGGKGGGAGGPGRGGPGGPPAGGGK